MERARAPIQPKPQPENPILKGLIQNYGDKSQYPKWQEVNRADRVKDQLSTLNFHYKMSYVKALGNPFEQIKQQESIGRIRDAYIGVVKEHFSPEAVADLKTNG